MKGKPSPSADAQPEQKKIEIPESSAPLSPLPSTPQAHLNRYLSVWRLLCHRKCNYATTAQLYYFCFLFKKIFFYLFMLSYIYIYTYIISGHFLIITIQIMTFSVKPFFFFFYYESGCKCVFLSKKQNNKTIKC